MAIQGNVDRLTDFAAELVALKPEVIVVSLGEVALAVKRATSTIPIVMANVADPVAAGLVESLERPGANITGVSRQTSDVIGKQLQLLKELVPANKRLGVLLNPSDRMHSVVAGIVKDKADSLGVQVNVLSPGTTAEIDGAFRTLRSERAGAVLVNDGGVLFLSRAQIAEAALRDRLPSMFSYREPVEMGGLMSYGSSSVANYKRAAYFVNRILKGAKPADLPIEQSAKFEFVINLKTAKALGIAIPPAMLMRADETLQ